MHPPAAKKPGRQQVETQLDAGSKESTHNPLADAASADPTDRYRQLCELLTRVAASGPEPFEAEIDGIRQQVNFSESEREVVAKIFRQGFEAALRQADQHKTWAYQRLLRRLLVGQPLDCPILGDNPYAALNQSRSPRSLIGSEAKRIFAAEENEAGAEPDLGAAGPTLGRGVSHRRRIVYAVAINLVAVGLWLGPLNPNSGDLARELPRAPEAEMRVIPSAVSHSPDNNAAAGGAGENGKGKSPGSDGAIASQSAAVLPVEVKPITVKTLAKPARPASGMVLQAVQEIGLRNEPQHSAPKGEALPPGTRLEVITTAGQWLKVRCENDGKIGYVRKEFVEPISPET